MVWVYYVWVKIIGMGREWGYYRIMGIMVYYWCIMEYGCMSVWVYGCNECMVYVYEYVSVYECMSVYHAQNYPCGD